MKKIITVCVLIIGFLLFKEYARATKDQDTILSKISSRVFEFNHFEVIVSDDLSLNDFKIKNENSGKVIYKNGKFIGGIKNDYGHCLFTLYHKGELIFEMGHFKTNNWHTNHYHLNIQKTNGIIDPTLTIIGPDEYRDFYYKRFEKNEEGFIKQVFINKGKEVYYERD